MATKTKTKTLTMPRASAKITLNFGMVSIPVALRPINGDRRDGVKGRLLCPDHQEPLKQFYKCETGDHYMTKGETVTGYETAKDSGTFVVLKDDVIESLVRDREQAAQIRQVVPTTSIDPIFYEKTYTLWPQDGAGQPHDLLIAALRSEDLSAIVSATISKQTRTFAIRYCEKQGSLVAALLFFDTDLRWEDGEVVSASVEERAGTITDEHLAVARTLIDSLRGEFDPTEITDTYTEALSEAIQAAAAGKPITPKAKPEAAAQADLLASLKASVTATSKAKAPKKTKAVAA